MSRVSDYLSALVAFLLFTFIVSAQSAVADDNPVIDAATKDEVITKVADLMRDHYVFPEVGAKMGEFIRGKHGNGDYDSYQDLKDFCRRVTTDLREVCDDKHIFLFYSPEEAREVAARKGLLPAEEVEKINQAHFEMSRRSNFGFSKIELLDGNVGYLKLDSFSGQDYACDVTSAAMAFLASADAIIVDLRGNGGGGGGVGPLLSSYFFDSERVQLTGTYRRETGEIEQSWTLPYVPGRRRPEVDLYILTSSRTFSAAEDFSYSLKHLNRATIVGEPTKGGAHPVDVMIVKGSILTQISIGNSVNPITNSNWETVGVKPDIEVPAEKALHTAHLTALKMILEKSTDDDWRNQLTELISKME
jgi:hypothetical protein